MFNSLCLLSADIMKEKNKIKNEKALRKEIEIPEGVEAKIDGNRITLKKGAEELTKTMSTYVTASQEGNKIILKINKARRKEKRNIGGAAGHIKNMIEGITKGFEYELEICNVHFPMTVEIDKAKKEVLIKNMLGEKTPRTMKFSDKVEIQVKAPKIIIKSSDIELAGQTATDFEKLTKIKNKDRNKFQDGIFITKKPGRVFL